MNHRRFYIDHGVIHDRVTGKHVVTDGQPPFEDSVEQVCELLNSLVEASTLTSQHHLSPPRNMMDGLAKAVQGPSETREPTARSPQLTETPND